MAPRAGFEPATRALTVRCSTAELPGNALAINRDLGLAKHRARPATESEWEATGGPGSIRADRFRRRMAEDPDRNPSDF